MRMTTYDGTGQTYARTRHADPRIGDAIAQALRGIESVANIGAGTGSYEPEHTVIAVEPSQVMIAQRAGASAPAVRAAAEQLPIRTAAVDAAMAILTIHHWADVERGVAEMMRIARRRIVILTWDHMVFQQFWLVRDYVPAAAETDGRLAVPLTLLTSLMPNVEVRDIPVPHDCIDGFGGAFWRRPHAYLDETVRAGMSLFALTAKSQLQEGLSRLHRDLENGSWAARYADLLDKPHLDLGYRLVVADL